MIAKAHPRLCRSRSACVSVVLALCVLCVPFEASCAEYIRVCSFNIAEFGEGDHHLTRDLPFIAKMLYEADLDLIALQEVGVRPQGESQVAELRKELNKLVPAGEAKYFYVVTPQSGDERCAVIYRFPVVQDEGIWWLDNDKVSGSPEQGGERYFRVPVGLMFHAGEFDFVLFIVHLTWGKLDRRLSEIADLREELRYPDDEKDWIVLGDMNRYGRYSKSSAKAFDQLLQDSDWNGFYRFPLLEAVTDPDDMKVYRAEKDEYSTTIAESKNLYDQFILTAGLETEFEPDDPKFGEDVGIIAFDMQEPYASMSDDNAVKYSVSDHRPVWIRLRYDVGDDD
ncbi:MAG TPA: endonuclease/exonuclease/phosphatase family protein [Phycisphaerae bacterium]|nr:endonuclease/exonuclease/phosphatase family protein [Phycisphaerae bacterium]